MLRYAYYKRLLCIIIPVLIVVLSVFILTKLFKSPAGKAADNFLYYLSSSDDRYKEYLQRKSHNHPFIKLCEQEKIKDYRVLGTKSISKCEAITTVSIDFEIGSALIELKVQKQESLWLVGALPKLNIYSHGIPIEQNNSVKGVTGWTVEIGGKTIDVMVLNDTQDTLTVNIPVSMLTLDGFLVNAKPLSTNILPRVMSLSNSLIEDTKLGYIPIKGDFPIYSWDNGILSYIGSFALPTGIESVTLYSTEDSIGRMAVFDKNNPFSDKIRVGLSDNDKHGLCHTSIKITCSQSFTALSPISSQDLTFNAGDIIEFRPAGRNISLYRNSQHIASSMYRWYIKTKDEATLNVLSISKAHSIGRTGTSYNGTLEVALYNGELVLINEIELEKYLKAVVPSEMPVDFGIEALKVQAVCARAYAMRAMQSPRYIVYGIHLEDSTNSQVYNNTEYSEIAAYAVDQTRGLVPYYNKEIVDTRYFSTSCGYTANSNEVWSGKDNEFPSVKIPYLVAKPQYPGNAPSLNNEENLKNFIGNTELPCYDKYSTFFRWSLHFTPEQLEASINQSLKAIFHEQPEFILTRTSENSYISMDIPEDIGRLQNIEVIKRGEGGNIMELEIATTHGVFKIIKEYNIRNTLKPVNYLPDKEPIKIKCHDGSVLFDFPLLPSAFAYIELKRNNEGSIVDIAIAGGGYGHGVGMSQYGTYGLTLTGMSFSEITSHYYPGSRLGNIYAR